MKMLGITDFKIWNAVTNDLANSKARHGMGMGTEHKCITYSLWPVTSRPSAISTILFCPLQDYRHATLNLWLSCQNLCDANHKLQQSYKEHHECLQKKIRLSATLQFLQVLILSNLQPKDWSPLNHVKWNHRLSRSQMWAWCNFIRSLKPRLLQLAKDLPELFFYQASIRLWKNPEKQVWSNSITVQSPNFRDSSDLRRLFVLTNLKTKDSCTLDIFLQRMQLFRPRPKPLAEGLLLASARNVNIPDPTPPPHPSIACHKPDVQKHLKQRDRYWRCEQKQAGPSPAKTCLHVWCYARLWAGVWGMMLTFLELAYMFDATQDYGLGCGERC